MGNVFNFINRKRNALVLYIVILLFSFVLVDILFSRFFNKATEVGIITQPKQSVYANSILSEFGLDKSLFYKRLDLFDILGSSENVNAYGRQESLLVDGGKAEVLVKKVRKQLHGSPSNYFYKITFDKKYLNNPKKDFLKGYFDYVGKLLILKASHFISSSLNHKINFIESRISILRKQLKGLKSPLKKELELKMYELRAVHELIKSFKLDSEKINFFELHDKGTLTRLSNFEVILPKNSFKHRLFTALVFGTLLFLILFRILKEKLVKLI